MFDRKWGPLKRVCFLPCTVPLLGFHNAILECVCVIQIEESPSSHLRVFFEYFFFLSFSFLFQKLCVPRMGEGDPAGILPAFFSLLSSLSLSFCTPFRVV